MAEDLIGRRVRVYWNLHRHCYSIQDAATRLVISHVDHIDLVDVVFKVSEAGRQRVLREGRKNVHAFVVGTVVPEALDAHGWWWNISYNPYKGPDFMMSTPAPFPLPVMEAEGAHLWSDLSAGRARPRMLAAVRNPGASTDLATHT